MRRVPSLVFALAFGIPLGAQQADPDPALLLQRREDKLAQPFLKLAPWHADLETAKRAAARDGKLILLHCTRSFMPCGTSIRCEREVLSAPEFTALAARVVLCVHVTAHLDAEADRLLYTTRGSGWPHHAVLDASGRVLGTHESWRDKSVAELAALVDRAQDFLRLESETAAAIAGAKRRLLLAGLETGALDLASARRLRAEASTTGREETERVAGALADLEVAEFLSRSDRFAESEAPKLGAEFHTMWRAGKRPLARNAVRDFWGGITYYVEKQEKPDLALFREALAKLEAAFGTSAGYTRFLEGRRKVLAELEKKAAEPAKTEPQPSSLRSTVWRMPPFL